MKFLKEALDEQQILDIIEKTAKSSGNILQKIQVLTKLRRDHYDSDAIYNETNKYLQWLSDLRYNGETTIGPEDITAKWDEVDE